MLPPPELFHTLSIKRWGLCPLLESGLGDYVTNRIWQKWCTPFPFPGWGLKSLRASRSVSWNGPGSRLWGSPGHRQGACVGVQASSPAEGPADGQPWQPDTCARKPSAACSPTTIQLHGMKEPEWDPLAEPSQLPEPSERIVEWLLLL